jgi:anti-sigma28 factor (negative regulator of flagellin synthesis)
MKKKLMRIFLKFTLWFVFSASLILIFAIYDIKQYAVFLGIWLILTIYIISYSPHKSQEVEEVKSQEVEETKNKKTFFAMFSYYINVIKARIEEEKQKKLKKQEEENLKITNIINQIHDGNYSVDVSIKLNNDEKAYFFIVGAEWHETRSTMKSIPYMNLSHTFKIGKGTNFKIGNIKPLVHKKSEFTKIATGDFYVTSNRIMLVSPSETKKINLSSIINVSIFSDGILLQRDSGKSVFIPMNQDKAILAKAIIDNI